MQNITLPKFSKSVLVLLFAFAFFVLLIATQGTADADTEVVPPLSHFTSCAFNTGGNATVLVPLDVAVNGTLELAADDEIAVFKANGSQCAGGAVWTGTDNIAIAAWGDNELTDPVDGLEDEKMQIRVWDDSAGQEYIAQLVNYSSGDGYYVKDTQHIMAALTMTTDLIFASFAEDGTYFGAYARDEDILAINPATGLAYKYLDFSDVGVIQDVDALLVEDNGDVLFSLQADVTIAGFGAVDESDIIRFSPTSIGETTAGTFEFVTDGSDIELTTSGEDVDALAIEPGNNRMLMSTLGSGWVRFGMRDEDIISFEPYTFGENTTTGWWRFYFDTSDTAIGDQPNIDALWVDETNGDMYMSLQYNQTVGGLSVAPGDILRCAAPTTGYTASCTTLDRYWDTVASGFGNMNIDALSILKDAPGDIAYISSQQDGTIDGVTFRDEDILVYDARLGAWFKYVDFSDLGVYGEVDALELLGDDVLFSINYDSTITGLGPVDDSDIIRFKPSSLGESSSGSLSLYFDGSDVELTTNAEDMDALSTRPSANRLLVSTLGSGWTRFGHRDEDLIDFDIYDLGTVTDGRWYFYFDTSDTDLTDDSNVFALWFDDSNGDIYLSTRYDRTVGALSVNAGDILRCVPGSTGYTASCTFSLYLDDTAYNLTGHNIDGMSLKLGNSYFTPSSAQALSGVDNYGLPHDAVGDEEFGIASPFELFDVEDAIEEEESGLGVQRGQKR